MFQIHRKDVSYLQKMPIPWNSIDEMGIF